MRHWLITTIAIIAVAVLVTASVWATLELNQFQEELVVENHRLYRENFNLALSLKAEKRYVVDLVQIQNALLLTLGDFYEGAN